MTLLLRQKTKDKNANLVQLPRDPCNLLLCDTHLEARMMLRALLNGVGGIILLLSCFAVPAPGAELYAPAIAETPARAPMLVGSCRQVWICTAYGCGWRHHCRPCPDRYSCYSLYGAYGPFGGRAYWGAYTAAGWGYR
jgi:hypothetical protein